MSPKLALAAAACLGVLGGVLSGCSPSVARSSLRAIDARERDRPYTLAEVDVGMLTLPAADLCPTSIAQCLTGDASVAVGIRSLYRFGRFAVGGGIDWATSLRSDPAPGPVEVKREHERTYFLFEGAMRYYPVQGKSLHVWVGPTAGLVVVQDAWSTLADREPYLEVDYIGPRSLSLGTVGGAVSAGVGLEWLFLPNWSLGTFARGGLWLLPDTRVTSPTLDQASLAGPQGMLQLGITGAYRIAL